MLSKSEQRQFGDLMNGSYAGVALSITAGAGQDGLENNTPWVAIPDRSGFKRPESAVLLLVFTTTLADTATLSLVSVNGQDASSVAGAGAADFDIGHSITVPVLLATGLTGGTTTTGGFRSPTLNLVGANTHIRFRWKVDLSAGSIDTVVLNPVIVWGGYGKEPSESVVEDLTA